MRKSFVVSLLSAGILLAGCQAVNTTSGGAVGVERKQYMFSMLSTDEVNQMYASRTSRPLARRRKRVCWTNPAPMPSAFRSSLIA